MKPEQRERLLAAADKLSRDLNNLDVAESFIEAHRVFSRLAEVAGQVKSREQLFELMESWPDLSWKDERIALAAFKYGKNLFRLAVIACANQAKDELPPPPGGRKRLFTTEEEKRVCEYVSALILKGVKLPNAYERAGVNFHVSKRSIRRIWEDRAEVAEELRDPDFDTTIEAVRAFLLEE